jgi:hypothetical protein
MPDANPPIIDAFLKGVPPDKMIDFVAEVKKKGEERLEQQGKAIEDLKNASGTISASESLFKGAFSSVLSDLKSIFPNMLREGFENVGNWFVQSIKDQISKDMDGAVRDGLLSEEAKTSLLGLADKNAVAALVLENLLFATSYLTQFGHIIKAGQSESLQTVNAHFRPNLFGPGEIIRACFTSPGDTPKVRALLARLGYKDDAIDLFLKAHYSTYSVGEAFSLWLRGVLDDGKLTERLRENGFTDDRIEELKHLYVAIPPISDIIFMLGKEAFEEDQVRLFGLDAEYPPEAEEWAAKQGLSPYWVKHYWRAHWNHAAPGQVLDMLHRGVVDEETVREYYRVAEIPPYWRDKLMKISYNPYTRVDVRRMYQLGILDTEDVYRAYLDEGYDEEHALNMTRFTVAYKIQAERDLTLTDIMNGFKAGILNKEGTRKYLTDLGYSEAEADFKIGYAEYTQALKEQTEAIALIGDQYKAGLIDEDLARVSLRSIVADETEVDKYLAKWGVAYSKTRRKPTKTELDKMVSAGIISGDQYIYELGQLGYSDKHIAWFVDLVLAELEG